MRAIRRVTQSVACLSARSRVALAPRMLSSEKNEDGQRPSTPLKEHFEYRNAKVNRVDDVVEIDNDEELQPQWKALEHRITRRIHKKEGLSGRSKRNSSAWDAENV